jgi:NADPH-dependent curcumin reductase CurA
LQENPMPRISEDGEILVRNLEMSLDPYIRGTMNKLSYGRKRGYPRRMEAGCVSQVVESRHAHYPVGALVNGQFGWCDYAVAKPDKLNQQTFTAVRQIPPHWQRTHALGILGMPGATAYLGLTEIINPKPGETVVVSSCTGAVGMVVGQMAKLLGAGKVVGFCSSSKLALGRMWRLSRSSSVQPRTGQRASMPILTTLAALAPRRCSCASLIAPGSPSAARLLTTTCQTR